MANPPRQKGTKFETEVCRAFGYSTLKRTAASTKWDLEEVGPSPIEILATRPDRGRTLVSLRLEDFAALYDAYCLLQSARPGLRIECKRYARFEHHRIFTEKFGLNGSALRMKYQDSTQQNTKNPQEKGEASGTDLPQSARRRAEASGETAP
jgi:hypothetical protein